MAFHDVDQDTLDRIVQLFIADAEGTEPFVYYDSSGIPTVGVGANLRIPTYTATL